MNDLQKQLKEQLKIEKENFGKALADNAEQLKRIRSRYSHLMHEIDDMQFHLPKLIKVARDARLEIKKIRLYPREIVLWCIPTGFAKFPVEVDRKKSTTRRVARAKQIEDTFRYDCPRYDTYVDSDTLFESHEFITVQMKEK